MNFILTGWKGYESGMTMSYEWCGQGFGVSETRDRRAYHFIVATFVRGVNRTRE